MTPVRLVRAALAGVVVASAVVTAAAALAPAANAAARDLGGVQWSVTKGNAETLLTIVTEKGCAADAKRVSAVLYGRGLPENGQVVVDPSTVLFSATSPMALPLSNAFVIYAKQNRTALQGTYRLKVRCTDRFGVNALGEFTSSMTWRTPGGKLANIDRATFTAKNTAKVDAADIAPDPELPVPMASDSASAGDATPKSDTTSPKPRTTSGAPSSAPSAAGTAPQDERSAAGASDSADPLAAPPPDGGGSDSTLQVLAVVAAFALLAVTGWWLFLRREDPA